MRPDWIPAAHRFSPWPQARVLVAGLGASGFAAADALLELGARVLVLDDSEAQQTAERAQVLEVLGAEVRLGRGATSQLPEGIDLVVTSPGWRPSTPLLAQATQRGVPIFGEVELAWRLQHPDRTPAWLAITGTNGTTTTTQMLESMLQAAGLRAVACGNIGKPVMETVLDPEPFDVLAVELSSFQLHWSDSLAVHSAAVLNIEQDHLEWYPSMADYAADKAKIYQRVTHSCVYNVADPATERMVEEAEVTEGARAIGFTLGIPAVSMLGVVDDVLVDRAFVEQRRTSALELASVSDVHPFAPHNVANALAAAALARSYGVPATAVRDGLRNLQLGGHRIQTVATVEGVAYVDDSKATNPHAALASLRAFESVVWIAGGQAKGTDFDDLVGAVAPRLRGAVLLGVDRQVLAEALRRHAPDLPVQVLDSSDTGVMVQAVASAAGMARPGDTVLLAPGCASRDMWPDYAARGDDFTRAAQALGRD